MGKKQCSKKQCFKMFENLNTLHVHTKVKLKTIKCLQTFVPFKIFLQVLKEDINENIIKLHMLFKYKIGNGIKYFHSGDENMKGRFNRKPGICALKFIFILGLSLQLLSVPRIQRWAVSARE